MNHIILQMLCKLTRLQRLTVAAALDADDDYSSIGASEDSFTGLAEIPAAVSQLQMLRSLRLLGHSVLDRVVANNLAEVWQRHHMYLNSTVTHACCTHHDASCVQVDLARHQQHTRNIGAA
jgi:hypothetical protein